MLARGREFLERKGVGEARLDAELLVASALGLDRLALFLALDRPVDTGEVERGRALLLRRADGEPTAYLLGAREFYGRSFTVGAGVLVPRPETELLVDAARELADGRDPAVLRAADVGTGSGCIAVTLALELPGSTVVATDRSATALAFARDNAARLEARVELREGDGLAPLAGERFDLLLSNPPYVDPADAGALPREVREHEPAEALFAPVGDPDAWVRTLVAGAGELLADGGALLVELGHDQG